MTMFNVAEESTLNNTMINHPKRLSAAIATCQFAWRMHNAGLPSDYSTVIVISGSVCYARYAEPLRAILPITDYPFSKNWLYRFQLSSSAAHIIIRPVFITRSLVRFF
jgi:hypothetical protein